MYVCKDSGEDLSISILWLFCKEAKMNIMKIGILMGYSTLKGHSLAEEMSMVLFFVCLFFISVPSM